MYKAAVIGDGATVLGFAALGIKALACSDAEEAADMLKQAAQDGCAVIFITEQLAQGLEREIAAYRVHPDIAVILIPSGSGTLGIGERELHAAVERAVGADILKDRQG